MTFSLSFLRRAVASLWLLAALPASPALSADRGPLDKALRALDEGVAEVAVVKLREQLALSLDPAIRREAKTKLAEALLAAGRTDEAFQQATDPEVQAPLLEGRIQAAVGHWEEALALYAAVAADPKAPQYSQALLGKAECLHALGRLQEAASVLEPLAASGPAAVSLRLAECRLEQNQIDLSVRILSGIRGPLTEAERKWKQYLEAQMLLAQNQMAEAFDKFEALQRDPRYLTSSMLVGIALGMTDSRTELTGLTAADDILEQFLWKHPESPSLGMLFQKLDEVYGGEENPSLGELEKWSKRGEPALRAGYATYYWAKGLVREAKPERALAVLEKFPTRFPGHPLLARALLLQGRLLADCSKGDAAQKTLEEALRAVSEPRLRGEIALAAAEAHFKAGEYVLAATVYRGAGEQTPAFAEIAGFNIALCWLHQGNYTRFAQEYADFSRLFPESPLRPDLVLEEGLLRARQHDPQAEPALRQFLADFPAAPRAAEARLALAELRYADGDPAGSRQFLRVVNENPAPIKTAEQSDFLALFVADAANPPDDEKVLALCREFIERHPASPHLPEVRMKLGQVCFRSGDFAGAQTQFETLALETPGSPLVVLNSSSPR